jgi:GTP cyclohydrolase II
MQAIIGPEIVLPTKFGDFEVVHICVSSPGAAVREGVALRRQSVSDEVLVRVQSSCLFSESFWATDCDCALQLQTSLARIAECGGTLLYFYEEGRGAGLEAKFRAIQLQQVKKMDTFQAYQCLNLRVDERSYEAAATALKKLHPDASIALLSNNPDKVESLRENGVNIVRREPLLCGLDQPQIKQYLEEKERLLGHMITEAKA